VFPLCTIKNETDTESSKQKRKSTDDRGDDRPVAKKIKSEPRTLKTPAIKKEKVAKVAKTPAKNKKSKTDSEVLSTPAPSSVERRRSGRGASARKSYADRDDSEDDQEMMDGVAQWEYVEGDDKPDEESESEGSPAADEEEQAETPEAEAEEEPEVEDEPEPTPPRSNVKKPPASKSAPKKTTPAAKIPPSKVAKQKQQPKPKSPLVKAKAKTPLAKPVAKEKVGKGKGREKSRVRDIFDMDDSD
jgi:sister-chromatid-cohesion protein PDS5